MVCISLVNAFFINVKLTYSSHVTLERIPRDSGNPTPVWRVVYSLRPGSHSTEDGGKDRVVSPRAKSRIRDPTRLDKHKGFCMVQNVNRDEEKDRRDGP